MLTLSFVLHLAVFFICFSSPFFNLRRVKRVEIKRHESHLPLQERAKIAANKISRVGALVADKTTGNHFLFPQTHCSPEQDTQKRINKLG